jgi:pyroglutamyl-peptidase
MLNTPAEPAVKRRSPRGGRPRSRVRLAITAFGPFPGVPFNASERLIEELAATRLRVVPAPLIATTVLPTDWRQAFAQLRAFIGRTRPDVLVHFGVSSRAHGFVIETRAFNQTSLRADCSGSLAVARYVRANAGGARMATLPAGLLVRRLRLDGIPARLSTDAGRYLCNAVLFESLVLAEAAASAPLVGFIHIPPLSPPESQAGLANGFGWDQLRRGGAVILDTLLRSSQPRPRGERRLRARGSFTLNHARP